MSQAERKCRQSGRGYSETAERKDSDGRTALKALPEPAGLSRRMMAVAGMVTAGYKLADIGTDHAYIPICLVKNGLVPGAVAMDVNEGPLERARKHIGENGLADRIELRLSDGFSALRRGEADCAVIAGMGGGLMIRILEQGSAVVRDLKECILQPQSELERVRAFLLEEGFFFLAEDMVKEDGKYYPMMKVTPPCGSSMRGAGREALPERGWHGTEKERAGQTRNEQEWNGQIWDGQRWNEAELRYGRLLLRERHPVLKEYLEREIALKRRILRQLSGMDSDQIRLRRRELESELRCAEKGMEYYAL